MTIKEACFQLFWKQAVSSCRELIQLKINIETSVA